MMSVDDSDQTDSQSKFVLLASAQGRLHALKVYYYIYQMNRISLVADVS